MSIIKRKAGSEDIVKSILEFDEVPTEGSRNLVESGAVAQAIGNLGQPLIPIGTATVSYLNGTIEGLQPGWMYTLTDSGTLTAGELEVEAGDEVAWGADGKWFKVGGETSKIAVFYGTVAIGPVYTFPDESDVRAAVDGGKTVIIKMSGVSGDAWYISGFKYGNQYVFCETMNPKQQLRLEDSGSGYAWSVVALPATNSVVTFTGTYDPNTSPVDYSGMPSTADVLTAIQNGNEVLLKLTNSGSPIVYRLVQDAQYAKMFAGMDNMNSGDGGYVNLVVMTYNGPNNPWSWASGKALQQALRTANKTESDISSGHMEIASNNFVTKLTLTTVNAVTMHTSDYSLPPNFAVEIDNTGNSNDVDVTVIHGPDTLKYSSAAGNQVGAGKYVQLTCVGNCWTLAEFEAPTP